MYVYMFIYFYMCICTCNTFCITPSYVYDMLMRAYCAYVRIWVVSFCYVVNYAFLSFFFSLNTHPIKFLRSLCLRVARLCT